MTIKRMASTLKTNMAKENVGLDFRQKNIYEARNDLSDDVKHNDLVNEKHKKVCRALNYFEHFLVFVSAFKGCVSIPAFASVIGVPVAIVSSAVGIKIYEVTAGIKKYKSIKKKKRKNHDKIELLVKTKLNKIEVLISKALIDLYINHTNLFK